MYFMNKQDREVLAFYNSLTPELDFVYARPPQDEKIEYTSGSGKHHPIRGGLFPLSYRLVEAYVDLETAIKRDEWDRAYLMYRYIKRILEG